MSRPLEEIKVFVAWPGDVKAERDRVFRVVDELDRSLASPLGLHLRAVDWKTVARPGRGRPQDRINDAVKGYDLFVGILGTRLGSDAGRGQTGFEEEFGLADAAWKSGKKKGKGPSLLLYFRDRATVRLSALDTRQLAAVQAFRESLVRRRSILFDDFITTLDFERKIRAHLTSELLDRLGKMAAARAASAPQPRTKASATDPPRTPAPRTPRATAPRRPTPTNTPRAPSVRVPVPHSDEEKRAFALKAVNAARRHFAAEARSINADPGHRGRASLAVSTVSDNAFTAVLSVDGQPRRAFRVRIGGWGHQPDVTLSDATTAYRAGEWFFNDIEQVSVVEPTTGAPLEYSLRWSETTSVAADVARHLWTKAAERLSIAF